jgi:hypothetical protein
MTPTGHNPESPGPEFEKYHHLLREDGDGVCKVIRTHVHCTGYIHAEGASHRCSVTSVGSL